MPCYTEPDREEKPNFLIDLLCKACRLLSKREMSVISTTLESDDKNIYTLLSWYKMHLQKDIKWNRAIEDVSFALDECKRMGINVIFSDEKEIND